MYSLQRVCRTLVDLDETPPKISLQSYLIEGNQTDRESVDKIKNLTIHSIKLGVGGILGQVPVVPVEGSSLTLTPRP